MNMEALKLASGFADCCDKAAKTSLPLCPTSQTVLSQEEDILIHILLEQALLNIFHFLFFSCRGSMTIFLAGPPNNVLTPRMSQGHIKIQILSSIWIKHCNVWMVFSIDVLVLFDGEGEGQTGTHSTHLRLNRETTQVHPPIYRLKDGIRIHQNHDHTHTF